MSRRIGRIEENGQGIAPHWVKDIAIAVEVHRDRANQAKYFIYTLKKASKEVGKPAFLAAIENLATKMKEDIDGQFLARLSEIARNNNQTLSPLKTYFDSYPSGRHRTTR